MPANVDNLLRQLARAEATAKRREAELRAAERNVHARFVALVDTVGATEAARLLGVSRNSVYQRLGRARRQLG